MAKNVTVITKIASTSHLTGAIDYVSSKKPHNSDNGHIKIRDFMTQGINCSENPKIAQQEMKHTLEMAKVPKNGVHAIKETKSFKGLDYRNKNDRYRAMLLNYAMMIKEHPNCQILSELQADGKGHKLHVHNVICPRRMTDLKSITSNQMDIRYYIKPKTDAIMKDCGFNTIAYKASGQRKSFGEIYHMKNGGSWVNQIKERLNVSRRYATNLYQYIHLANELNVHVECVKMHTVNGKRQIHYYKTRGKDPHRSIRVTSGKHKGQYMRLRKHLSYDYKFKGHKYKIRDKKLGADYSIPGLYKQTKHNLKLNTYQKLINKEKSMDITPNTSNNNSSRVAESNLKSNQHPKSVSHRQSSDGRQPVMTRAKNDESGKKAINSIEHSPKSTSVVKAQKLMKYVHMGTFTVPGYTKRATKTKSGKVIPLSNPVPVKAKSFHFPVIRLPHKPSIPIFQFLGSKDTEAVIAMNARLNSDKMDQYKQQYSDYMSAKDARSEAIDANRDMDAQTRQTNRDTAKDAHEKHLMLIKEIRARRGMSR